MEALRIVQLIPSGLVMILCRFPLPVPLKLQAQKSPREGDHVIPVQAAAASAAVRDVQLIPSGDVMICPAPKPAATARVSEGDQANSSQEPFGVVRTVQLIPSGLVAAPWVAAVPRRAINKPRVLAQCTPNQPEFKRFRSVQVIPSELVIEDKLFREVCDTATNRANDEEYASPMKLKSWVLT